MCEWLWRLLCIHVVMLLFSALELFQVHRLNAPRFPLASSDTALASINEMSVFTLALSLFRSPGPLQSVYPLVIHRSGFAPCRPVGGIGGFKRLMVSIISAVIPSVVVEVRRCC